MSNKTYAGLRQPKLVDQRPRVEYNVDRSGGQDVASIRLIGDGTFRVSTDDHFQNMYVEECFYKRFSNTLIQDTREIVNFEFVKTGTNNSFNLEFAGCYQIVISGINTKENSWYTNIDSFASFLGNLAGEPIYMSWKGNFIQNNNLDLIITISNGVVYVSTWLEQI